MKNLLSISLIAIAITVPVASLAQQPANGPLTGADVRAQSAQAAQDHRMQSKVHYPATEQSASANQSADTGGYGPQNGGSSESRMLSSRNAVSSSAAGGVFAHH
jgi:type II secretory pathway pseudopilin PulG